VSVWHRPAVRPSESVKGGTRPSVSSPPPRWRKWILPVAFALTALLFFLPSVKGTESQAFSYNAFIDEVKADKVATATISDTG